MRLQFDAFKVFLQRFGLPQTLPPLPHRGWLCFSWVEILRVEVDAADFVVFEFHRVSRGAGVHLQRQEPALHQLLIGSRNSVEAPRPESDRRNFVRAIWKWTKTTRHLIFISPAHRSEINPGCYQSVAPQSWCSFVDTRINGSAPTTCKHRARLRDSRPTARELVLPLLLRKGPLSLNKRTLWWMFDPPADVVCGENAVVWAVNNPKSLRSVRSCSTVPRRGKDTK